MTLEELSLPLVNWPLFLLTSLVITLRIYAPMICLWFVNKFHSPSTVIDQLTSELKTIVEELKTISQQDEFASYARKERRRNAIVQRLKDERNAIETKQKTLLSSIRLILNIAAILFMIFLTITGQRHRSVPLFNFPFFRFPFIIWIIALNTFLTNIAQIFSRFSLNKKPTD